MVCTQVGAKGIDAKAFESFTVVTICDDLESLRLLLRSQSTPIGRLIFLPLLVLTRRGAAPVKTSTGNNFLDKTREVPEIITSTGAKFWLRFLPFSTGTGNFQVFDPWP